MSESVVSSVLILKCHYMQYAYTLLFICIYIICIMRVYYVYIYIYTYPCIHIYHLLTMYIWYILTKQRGFPKFRAPLHAEIMKRDIREAIRNAMGGWQLILELPCFKIEEAWMEIGMIISLGFVGENLNRKPSIFPWSWGFPVNFPLNQPIDHWNVAEADVFSVFFLISPIRFPPLKEKFCYFFLYIQDDDHQLYPSKYHNITRAWTTWTRIRWIK